VKTNHNDRRKQMDTKQIIDMHMNVIDGQKEELRKSFLAELKRLSDEASTAADHRIGTLPTLAWLETGMARLQELRETFEKAECARDILRRVSEAAEFEAGQKASAS
jgi:hypothetical protein